LIRHLRGAQKKAEDVYDKMALFEIEEKFGKSESGRLDCNFLSQTPSLAPMMFGSPGPSSNVC